jgi:hypothetical protein
MQEAQTAHRAARRRYSLGLGLATFITAAAGAVSTPTVTITPHVALLGERAVIVVQNWPGRNLQVALMGATNASDRAVGWVSAEREGPATWVADLPAPKLRGIYPILLRSGSHGHVVQSQYWLLRVFRRRAESEPSFSRPPNVVRWWVRRFTHGTLRALREWPRPAFDKRDLRLHRLYVVAWSPPGRPAVADRLGMFVTTVRDGFEGRWRLLEATEQP